MKTDVYVWRYTLLVVHLHATKEEEDRQACSDQHIEC